MFDLKGKNALVTGATGGIGGGIAKALHGQGATVAISGTNAEKLEALATALGERVFVLPCDLRDRPAVVQLADSAEKTLGQVDILVNNAGITRDNLSIRMGESDWDLVMSINLKGTFLCSQFAAKEMMKKRFGRIVNLASVSGILGTAGQANYAASKAGIIALSKSMARELGSRNITVNAVAPGFILTEMTEKLPENVKEAYIAQIALKRAGTPEDVAEAVYFLASPAAQYITGTVLNVSGGLLI